MIDLRLRPVRIAARLVRGVSNLIRLAASLLLLATLAGIPIAIVVVVVHYIVRYW